MGKLIPAALALALLASANAGPALAAAPGLVRVDQVGYWPGESKHAYLMTRGGAGRFTVVDRRGRVVLTGRAGRDRGAWNSRYPHVYDLDLTRLRTPGRYRVKAGGATSAEFGIAPAQNPAAKVLGFLGLQRDGADAPREPSHRNDRAASVYDWPTFTGPETDEIKGRLTRDRRPGRRRGRLVRRRRLPQVHPHPRRTRTRCCWAAQRDGTAHRLRPAEEAGHGLE